MEKSQERRKPEVFTISIDLSYNSTPSASLPSFLLNNDPSDSITFPIGKARDRVQRYDCLDVITKLAVRNWGLSTNEEHCEMNRKLKYWEGFTLSRDWTCTCKDMNV